MRSGATARTAPRWWWEDSVNLEKLIFRSVTARSVLVPLRRPIVSKVGLFDQWPMILIELATEQGIVGRSYLEPYLKHAARYIVPAIHDLAEQRKGHGIYPIEDFQNGRRALNLIGYEGLSMIAVSGLDMAAWDALAKAAGMPLAVLLGGSTGPVPAYNSNGLWLTEVAGLPRLPMKREASSPKAASRPSSCGWAATDWLTISRR